MDALVRLRLEALGAWITPWQADSLLGALAVSWMREYGTDAFKRDFIDPWLANEPRFVVSDAFPEGSLPAPASLALPMWDWRDREPKEIKRRRFLSWCDFRRVQNGLKPDLSDTLVTSVEDHILIRNSLSRSTDTTIDDGGLFEVPYSRLNNAEASLIVYARTDDSGLDILMNALRLLGRTGFGARASTGYGGFEISQDPESCSQLDDVH